MFNVGAGELIVILLIALIVLGPDRLPDAARKMGRFVAQVRQMSNGFQTEMRQAMNVDEFSNMVNPKTLFDTQPTAKGGPGPSLPPLESEVAASNRTDDDAPAPPATAADGTAADVTPPTAAAPQKADAAVGEAPHIRAVPDEPPAGASPAA